MRKACKMPKGRFTKVDKISILFQTKLSLSLSKLSKDYELFLPGLFFVVAVVLVFYFVFHYFRVKSLSEKIQLSFLTCFFSRYSSELFLI